jgi:Protein of unknown function (DUF2630)
MMPSDDKSILERVDELVGEEKSLRSRHIGAALDANESRRLTEVEEELDQCWDLLNQRRALRNVDMDPDQAAVRDVDTVENYRQ